MVKLYCCFNVAGLPDWSFKGFVLSQEDGGKIFIDLAFIFHRRN